MKRLTAVILALALLLTAPAALAANKVRVFVESNLTPVFGPNAYYTPPSTRPATGLAATAPQPIWVQNQASRDYALALGYDEFTMIYNGTLNRADTWWGHTAAEVANGQVFWTDPVTGASNEHNYADPPDPGACARVATLHRTNPYGSSKKLLMPVCFDIENSPSIAIAWDDSDDVMAAKAERVAAAIRAARSYAGGGPEAECWWYEFPGYAPTAPASPAMVSAIDRFYKAQAPVADVVTAACCSFYNWDVPATNAGAWFAMPREMDRVIARYYPHLRGSKVAFVLPYYQVYWPGSAPPGVAAKNGTPVKYADWCAQIDYLVENGWDIVVWMGNYRHEPVAQHLTYVAKYRR